MNDYISIENKLTYIINQFLPFNDQIDDQTKLEIRNKCLHIIMSDSQQAILFISMIEDEFEIEFHDNDLTLDNLLSYKIICSLVANSGV